MTVPVQSATEPSAAAVDATVSAAAAAAGALPVAGQVTLDDPAAGPVAPPAGETVGIAASLVGDVTGTLVLVVGADVLAALREGPLGALDPVAGMQPTLDAAATALGARAESATAVDAAQVLAQAGSRDVSVRLVSGGAHVATLLAVVSPAAPTRTAGSSANGLDLLRDVEMEVTVEIGRTRMTVRELLALTPGTVVELDRAAGSPADLLVNGTLLARGEIVVVDEDFGIRITEIVSSNLEMDGTGR
jgi:flagellar motor switch protein FliN/FliY